MLARLSDVDNQPSRGRMKSYQDTKEESALQLRRGRRQLPSSVRRQGARGTTVP